MKQQTQNQVNLTIRSISAIFKSAWVLISQPSYWKYFGMSIVLNIAAFIGMLLALIWISDSMLESLPQSENSAISSIVITLSDILSLVLGIFGSAFLFPTVSMIVNAPVYDALTEKVIGEEGYC